MAKYDITYSCGHSATIQLFGNLNDRKSKIEWLEANALCPECCKRQHIGKLKDVSDLIGTEKQVAWAAILRNDFFAEMEKLMSEISSKNGINQELEERFIKFKEYFEAQVTAKYWIENRDVPILKRLKNAEKAINKNKLETNEIAVAAKDEATVYPEDESTKDVAEIKDLRVRIELKSPNNGIIRSVIKKLGWKWDGEEQCWYYKITVTTGTSGERIAEAGNALLRAGVPIRIFDEETREKAILGEYEPRYTEWITLDPSSNCLKAIWDKSKDLYPKIKGLPKARYKNGAFYIDPKYYEEIRDFATLYNFKISPKANEALLNEEEADRARIRISPKTKNSKEQISGDEKLNEILKSSCDILDDLKDDT